MKPDNYSASKIDFHVSCLFDAKYFEKLVSKDFFVFRKFAFISMKHNFPGFGFKISVTEVFSFQCPEERPNI